MTHTALPGRNWSGESHLEREREEKEREKKKDGSMNTLSLSLMQDKPCVMPSAHRVSLATATASWLHWMRLSPLGHIKDQVSRVTWAIKYPSEETASGSIHEGIRVNIRSVPVH